MTKHHKTDIPIENPSSENIDPDLQAMLQELEIEKSASQPQGDGQTSSASSSDGELLRLQKELLKLQSQFAEKEEIAKKAQIDYINLKSDFDFLLRQTKLKEETLEQETLIKVVKNLLPFLEDLRKSLLHLTELQKAEPLGQGVQMVYEKFLKTLAEFSIFPIEAIGLEPDTLFHEPVTMQPASKPSEKGKIIGVFEQGFYLKKGAEQLPIIPSKVIIAS